MPIAGPIAFPSTPMVTSDALTIFDLNNIFTSASQAILQIDPNTDSQAFYKVRTTFPTAGAPAFKITDDVLFVTPKPIDDDYNRVRDEEYVDISPTEVHKVVSYTRVLRVEFCVFGPNSLDNARALRSGYLEQLIHDFLEYQGLYLIPDNAEPSRNPENFDGQWWERVDFALRFNELVHETTVLQTVKSVEVIVDDASSPTHPVADITVTPTP